MTGLHKEIFNPAVKSTAGLAVFVKGGNCP